MSLCSFKAVSYFCSISTLDAMESFLTSRVVCWALCTSLYIHVYTYIHINNTDVYTFLYIYVVKVVRVVGIIRVIRPLSLTHGHFFSI